MVAELNNDITVRRDWARENHVAKVYVLQAKGEMFSMVKDVVKKYIEELRNECSDD